MAAGAMTEVDYARIGNALEPFRDADDDQALAAVLDRVSAEGAAALVHHSGQRALPGRLIAQHNLAYGQVRLGAVARTASSRGSGGADFAVDQDALRTSMLVIGPPGSGKTRGFALPIIEHLSLGALAGQSSVVVIDPKGDDFGLPGWFDATVDLHDPGVGFDLYGGAATPESAADRLASALLPSQTSDDLAYFMDGSRNALHRCLSPFHEAFGRYPAVRELLALLRSEQGAVDRVKSELKGPGGKAMRALLDERRHQARGSHDAAAGMVERLSLLDRPKLAALLDGPGPKFQMSGIDAGARVRFALDESEYPDASRILARLAVAQFVQVASSSRTNRNLFKGLVIDEAGRFVDEYVARGVQRLRSNNAGLVLLSQSIADFPEAFRNSIFGAAGCKAVFGAVDPDDAEQFSRSFGEEWIAEVTVSGSVERGETRSWSSTTDAGELFPRSYQKGRNRSASESSGFSHRKVERARWTPSDIMTGLPTGRCLAVLTGSDGRRFGPVEVDLRA
jgi:hypothetical protein